MPTRHDARLTDGRPRLSQTTARRRLRVSYVDPFRDAAGAHADRRARSARSCASSTRRSPPGPRCAPSSTTSSSNTQALIPCDRIGLAFVEESRRTRHQLLQPRRLRAAAHRQGLLRGAARQLAERRSCAAGSRASSTTSRPISSEHPRSRSTRLLVKEGVRSSLTCPLSVEGRIVGFIFRSSRQPHAYRPHHIELQMAITERLSQAVEKAWRIEQLEEANHAYTRDARLREPRAQEPRRLHGHRRPAHGPGLSRRPHARAEGQAGEHGPQGAVPAQAGTRVPRPRARRGRRAAARRRARGSTSSRGHRRGHRARAAPARGARHGLVAATCRHGRSTRLLRRRPCCASSSSTCSTTP